MPAESIILTGAPRPSSLTWEESILINDCWFCIAEKNAIKEDQPSRWRVVTPPNNYSQNFTPNDNHDISHQASFLRMGAIERYTGLQESMSQGSDLSSHFYDYSFALHEGTDFLDLSNSVSYDDTEEHPDNTSIDDTKNGSYNTDQAGNEGNGTSGEVPSIQPGHLSDLEDIPSATYLLSLSPQTIVVNLIVAVITILPRKRVRTRWGYFMDILELVVGDETKTGFGITCWLPPTDEPGQETTSKIPFERSLAALRPCDIVVVRSVALGTFRGQVYGQSLRHNRTTIDLLHRKPVDLIDDGGSLSKKALSNITDDSDKLLDKVRRVADWISTFTAPDPASLLAKRDAMSGQNKPVFLPPDSQ